MLHPVGAAKRFVWDQAFSLSDATKRPMIVFPRAEIELLDFFTYNEAIAVIFAQVVIAAEG